VTSIAFSPDGQYLLTGSEDHTALLWQISDNALLWNSGDQGAAILDLDFSSQGGQFAIAQANGEVTIWSLVEGR
jgi:WD40 repeat protein